MAYHRGLSLTTLNFLALLASLCEPMRVSWFSVVRTYLIFALFFFFSSRRRHTRYWRDWSSDVCSSDLVHLRRHRRRPHHRHHADRPAEVVPGRPADRGDPAHRRDWRDRRGAGRGVHRSEERRVGEEGRTRWVPDPLKKKKK